MLGVTRGITMLESSPEAFAERLNERLRRQDQNHRIGPDDVLPGDVRYWDHLTAAVEGSVTLAEFIEKELHETWRRQLEKNPVHAFHKMATTFAAPALVPRSLAECCARLRVHGRTRPRVCGNGGIDPDEMISWARRVCGETYFLSVVSDFAVRRPESEH
jgi:hypothetical protein